MRTRICVFVFIIIIDSVYTQTVITPEANPVFTQPPPTGGTVNVDESAPVGDPLLTLAASDIDGVVLFDIFPAVPQFGLDGKDIVSLVEFDYETTKQYTITVRVYNTIYSDKISNNLTINIRPVNEHAPVFTPSVIHTTVKELTAADSLVVQLTCSDLDQGDVLGYELIISGDDPFNKFKINGDNVMTTNNPLDFDTLNAYKLIVKAVDRPTTGQRLTGNATIFVTIIPVNEFIPVFVNVPYITSIAENAVIGTKVIEVSAFDRDEGIDGDVTYSIADGNTEGKFSIIPKSGNVFINNALDYETTQSYNLTILARDRFAGDGQSYSSTSVVYLTVTPINDNVPSCDPKAKTVSIPESTAIGATAMKVTCSDPDVGTTLTYQITSGDLGYFQVTSSGEIKVIKALAYDEGIQFYDLIVEVSDGNFSTNVSTRINVDSVNNFPPIFPNNPVVYINENEPLGTKFYQYNASDKDVGPHGTIMYSIDTVTNGGANNFMIDDTTGTLQLSNMLDYESVKNYGIVVLARDRGGSEATGTVTVSVVNVNDNIPLCSPHTYSIPIPEDTTVQTTVIADLKCSDADGDQLSYEIVQIPPDANFAVSASGSLYINGTLDHETTPFYEIRIYNTDGINKTVVRVMVDVVDVNEAAPLFTNAGKYFTTISEDSPVGTILLTVAAFDSDNDPITFSFDGTYSKFMLDSSNGTVFLRGILDRELMSSHQLSVIASDGQRSSTATVYVTVEDVNELPKFEHTSYSFTNEENSTVGTYVGTVKAVDLDNGTNGELRYKIVSGNTNSHFAVNPISGVITVSIPTDYEGTKSIVLTIEARDLGATSLSHKCTVNIKITDINDNAPEFATSSFSVRLNEDVAIGTSVTQISARDLDSSLNRNNQFEYMSTSSVPFKVHPSTGLVTVNAALDREIASSFNMTILAVDKGVSPMTGSITLIIMLDDVNDNYPIINETFDTTLSENIPLHYVVFQIQAYDKDGGEYGRLRYSIESGNFETTFKIEPHSGILQVASKLDREKHSLYKLGIKVSDFGTPQKTTSVTATVSVSDVNDVTPTFTLTSYKFAINEHVPVGTLVGHISAIDNDEDQNSKLTYQIFSVIKGSKLVFEINQTNGKIYTNATIDREEQAEYAFSCRVQDGGDPMLFSEVTVTIIVNDINDNSPVFRRNSYSTIIKEDFTIGNRLLTMGAFDLDQGNNGDITFALDMSTPNGLLSDFHFTIHPTYGDIILKRAVDFEKHKQFSMVVIAKDGGTPSRSATTNITIDITDVNDNAPIFTPSFYNTEASMINKCKRILTTVTAQDIDQGNNAVFEYIIDPAFELSAFAVDAITGDINSRYNLNDSQYIISVNARDNGKPSLTSPTGATIRIDVFKPDVHIISFDLNYDLDAYMATEKEFINQITEVISLSYPSSYVRRWCIDKNLKSVKVHMYAVKNDLTNAESNLHLTKPFLSQEDFLDTLKLDGDNIPTANPPGKTWNRFPISNVASYGKKQVDPPEVTKSPIRGTDDSSVSVTVPLAASLPLLAVLGTVAAILSIVAWKRRWCRKKNTESKDSLKKPRTKKIKVKPKDQKREQWTFNGPLGKHWILRSRTDPDINLKSTSDQLRRATLSLTDLRMKNGLLYNDDSLIGMRSAPGPFIYVKTTDSPRLSVSSETVNDLPATPILDNNSPSRSPVLNVSDRNGGSTSNFSKRGMDPVTGWVFQDNVDTDERNWLRTPDGDPIFNRLPYA